MNQADKDFLKSHNAHVKENGQIWYKGVVFNLDYHSWKPGLVTIINLEAEKQNQGYGTKVLTELCQWFDGKGLTCLIFADPFHSDMSLRKLKQWYKKHGFKAQPKEKHMMKRKPQK